MSLFNKMWPNSTNIASATYNDELETLDITFQRGAQYRYIGVHPDVWKEFSEALSPGKFFDANIKGVYEYKRL